MGLVTICASHTPLLHDGPVAEDLRSKVDAGFASLAKTVGAFAPDLIIQFSPDHFNGFTYRVMPPFCIGTGAVSVGDFDTVAGPLEVPGDEARSLCEAILAADIDIALSYDMKVDHGFVQIWEEMFGTQKPVPVPIIPIFINSAAAPLPSYRRARLLGEAVGRWAVATGKKVLIAASGGLSHDPPFPDIRSAEGPARNMLIDGQNPAPEARAIHKARVLAAGAAAAKGEPPCQPLNPQWDHQVIEQLIAYEPGCFDSYVNADVLAKAGRGGNEILSWVAAFAAQSVAGSIDAKLHFYEPIASWIAGMAMMSAQEAEVSKLPTNGAAQPAIA